MRVHPRGGPSQWRGASGFAWLVLVAGKRYVRCDEDQDDLCHAASLVKRNIQSRMVACSVVGDMILGLGEGE